MDLDKDKLVPILESNGFQRTTANTWVTHSNDKRYLVDFKNGHICRTQGEYNMERIHGDPEDTFLNAIITMCKDVMSPDSDGEQSSKTDALRYAVGHCAMENERAMEDGQVEEDVTKVYMIPSEQKLTVLPPVESVDIVRPAISSLAAKQAWQEYLDMRNTILEKSDFQKIQGKDFIKKSGWRKFATFYNLTDTIVDEKRIDCPDGSFIWKIKVLCTAPNGRVTEGVAMCSSREKSGTRIEHDVYSTAHTRAKNRSISDMIAAGEVSAEEVEA